MKSTLMVFGAAALVLAPSIASAQASQPSPTTQSGQALGQPNQSCQEINGGNTGPYYPGNTQTAPGSAFNETSGIAGGVYAGNQPQNSNNPASVSQYDVACFNQSQRPH